MALVSDDALILQSFAYSETSKILRLLTREHGVRAVIAKGALRPKSRYGGILEPFTEGVATMYLKEGRDMLSLSGFELVRSRQRLGLDLVRFGAASLVAEIVLRTASEAAEPRLFDQVRRALNRIETAQDNVEAVALAEAWALVSELGFAPALDACVTCGRPLEPDETASFDFAAGGVRCAGCATGHAGRPISPDARALLARLCAGEPVEVERPDAHWRLLARFLRQHVVEGAPLRSLEFLGEATGGSP